MRIRNDTGDYEVGYGKPPKSGQYTKGVSGNPSGRPKKTSDFDSKLMQLLESPLMINENGKRKVITKAEGIRMQAVNKALNGHVPSMRLVDNWRRQALQKRAEQQPTSPSSPDCTACDLSDEELMEVIRSGHVGNSR